MHTRLGPGVTFTPPGEGGTRVFSVLSWGYESPHQRRTPVPSPLRAGLQQILRTKALSRRDEAIQLACGAMSRDFIDGKEAFAAWQDLKVACDAIVEAVAAAGIEFDAAGGPTLGADALAVGIAAVSNKRWFIVRKRQKGRGTGRRIEGLQIGRGDRVLLVEDVVTTGGSVIDALGAVRQTGAEVVAAVTLADRGDTATNAFHELGVPYFPMATYADLGIDPVVPPTDRPPMAESGVS